MNRVNSSDSLNEGLEKIRYIELMFNNEIEDLERLVTRQKQKIGLNQHILCEYQKHGLENVPQDKHDLYNQVVSDSKKLLKLQKKSLKRMNKFIKTGNKQKAMATGMKLTANNIARENNTLPESFWADIATLYDQAIDYTSTLTREYSIINNELDVQTQIHNSIDQNQLHL